MALTTPKLALPYPEDNDDPDIPRDIKNLAMKVDDELGTVLVPPGYIKSEKASNASMSGRAPLFAVLLPQPVKAGQLFAGTLIASIGVGVVCTYEAYIQQTAGQTATVVGGYTIQTLQPNTTNALTVPFVVKADQDGITHVDAWGNMLEAQNWTVFATRTYAIVHRLK